MASGTVTKPSRSLNNFVNPNTYTDISSYTESNPFVCPTNGIITLSSYGGGRDVVSLNGADIMCCLGSSDYETKSFHVFKGDSIYLRVRDASSRFFQFRETK